jgi:hypothetical protein
MSCNLSTILRPNRASGPSDIICGFCLFYKNCGCPLETVSHASVYIFLITYTFLSFPNPFLPTPMKIASDVESGFPNPRAQEEGNAYY